MITLLRILFRLMGYLLVLALFALVALLGTAGFWLPEGDEPMKAEAMVVLSGSALRAAYAADLYEQDMAPVVYVARPARTREQAFLDGEGVYAAHAEMMQSQVLVAKNVPQAAIVFYGQDLASMEQEAEALAGLLGEGNGALLVVASPAQERRAGLVFAEFFPNREVRVVGSPYDPLPKAWWTDREAARQVFSEAGNLVYHFIGGSFLENHDDDNQAVARDAGAASGGTAGPGQAQGRIEDIL